MRLRWLTFRWAPVALMLTLTIVGCQSHRLLSDHAAREELRSATNTRNATITLTNATVQTGRFVRVGSDTAKWIDPEDRSLPAMISASHVRYSTFSRDRFTTCYGLDNQTELCGRLLAVRNDTAYLRLMDSMRRVVPTSTIFRITAPTPKPLLGAAIGGTVGFFVTLIAVSAAPQPKGTGLESWFAAGLSAYFGALEVIAGTVAGSTIGAIIGSENETLYTLPTDSGKTWTHVVDK